MSRIMRSVGILLSVMLCAICNFASAQKLPEKEILKPGDILQVDYRYYSHNNLYYLLWQFDGNLVIYLPHGKPVWSSGTDNRGAKAAIFGTDGNLVITRDLNDPNGVVWASNTGGTGPNVPRLVLVNNGSMEVYGASGRTFKTPKDPHAPPITNPPWPIAACSAPRQFAACAFKGSESQTEATITACSVEDAMQKTAELSAEYGACGG